MIHETVIESKTFYDGRVQELCIGIDEGIITSIKKILQGEKKIRFTSGVLLPGAIDTHVHFRSPGEEHKEDFFTGTLAAMNGGVTTVMDMPNNIRRVDTYSSIFDKLENVESRANVDFGLYGALTERTDVDRILKIANAFKVYMGETTGGIMVDVSNLKDKINTAVERNVPVVYHAEKESCIKKISRNIEDHFLSRSPECEKAAIEELSLLKKAHIAHISSQYALEALQHQRPNGATAEVTPHHLFLNIKSARNSHMKDSYFKVNPPLRTEEDNIALLKALNMGRIDSVASDHAPHTIEEKSEAFDNAPAGMPGTETMYPLMYHAAYVRGIISLERVVSVISEFPSERFNMLDRGKIEIGKRADMVHFVRNIVKIRGEHMHSKCGWTPYEGMEAIFPSDVFLNGERVIEEYETVVTGNGRKVPV